MIGPRFALVVGAILGAACTSDVHETGGAGDASADGPPAGGADSGDGGGVDVGADVGADVGPDVLMGNIDGGAGQCSVALPVSCGDRLNHSTVIHGRANLWSAYSWTARLESGRETVYAFQTTSACSVVANLKNLTTDLDLLLLSACHPVNSNLMASSTPLDLQTVETVKWTSSPGHTYYLAVDGYDRAEGSYTLEIDCTCSR